jgi:hypothetical protein
VTERSWSRAAYAYGVVVALGLAYLLFRMPYQVSDNLEHMMVMQFQSVRDILADSFGGDGSLRPVLWLQQRALFELTGDAASFMPYKVVHAIQLLVVMVLFVRLLRVRSAFDLAVLPLAVAALAGMHTFNVTMREGYPINHYMTVLIACLAVTNLAASSRRWWSDFVAVVVFTWAIFMFETGLLVWVCVVAGYMAGWRGISLKGVAAVTAVLAIYLVVRLVVLDVGTRTLASMSSGYGFSVRNTGELVELFGDAPWKFYSYNIASAALTVLFSEPRTGVFQLTSFFVRGDVPTWSLVNVVVSVIGTTLIAVLVPGAVRRWRNRELTHPDRILLVFLAVLMANAVISYPYLKDVVMSPAGVFYAAALFVGTRALLQRLSERGPGAMTILAVVPLVILSAGWTLRAATLAATMRQTAFVNRSDWAVADEHMNRNRPEWRGRHPDAERMFQALREEVVRASVPQPYTMPRWTRDWLDPY